jgi:hypothetical protein
VRKAFPAGNTPEGPEINHDDLASVALENLVIFFWIDGPQRDFLASVFLIRDFFARNFFTADFFARDFLPRLWTKVFLLRFRLNSLPVSLVGPFVFSTR